MAFFRNHHFLVSVPFFALAGVLSLAGYTTGATVLLFAAVLVEGIAWLLLLA